MSLKDIFSLKRVAHGYGSDRAVATAENHKGDEREVGFEMDLHVPCRVEGVTEGGYTWKGEATTLSISSYGAQLSLPVDAELEGDIEITFKVPPPLATLFVKEKFRVDAKVYPSELVGPGSTTMGRAVVYVVFAEALYFR
jgi:hypothetical protein